MRTKLAPTIVGIVSIMFLFISGVSCAQNSVFWSDTFDDHGAIMLLIDIETGRIVNANKAASNFYGYSVEQLENMVIDDLRNDFSEIHQDVLATAGQEKNYFILSQQLANGEERIVEVHSYPVDGGEGTFLFCVINDITARQVAEMELLASKERLHRAEFITGIGNWEYQVNTNRFFPSEGAKRVLGLGGDEWTMSQIDDLVVFEDQAMRFQAYRELIEEGIPYDIEFRFRRGSDEQIIVLHSMAEYDPETETVFGVLHDITEQVEARIALEKSRKVIIYSLSGFVLVQVIIITNLVANIWRRRRAEDELRNEKELFRTTLLSVGDGVITTDQNGCVNIMNDVAEQITGWTQQEAMGLPLEVVFHTLSTDLLTDWKRFRCERSVSDKGVGSAKQIRLIAKDGIERHVSSNLAPITTDWGEVQGIVVVFRDITEEKEQERIIEYLSYHDQLTGLYNRTYFEKELKRLDNESSLPLSVIIADLNGLKLINDAFGHRMGDRFLKTVAEVIKRNCREKDVVARWGGDEFIILLPATNSTQVEAVARRIQNKFRETTIDSVSVSVSLGWYTKQHPDEEIKEVFDEAENNMYRAKLFASPGVLNNTLKAIMESLYEKSKWEEGHSQRVCKLSKLLGSKLKLSEKEVEELGLLGNFHDIGKVAIDGNILNKPGKLTEDEFREIKRHPEVGYRILKLVKELEEIANCVLTHHERWDGKGYPKGLKGEEIPIQSRILAVVDAFDAMVGGRSYSDILSLQGAIKELENNAGTQFDPEIVAAFIDLLFERGEAAVSTVSDGVERNGIRSNA